jgi:hypothetical protein
VTLERTDGCVTADTGERARQAIRVGSDTATASAGVQAVRNRQPAIELVHQLLQSQVEREMNNISIDNIERLAEALGVDILELLAKPK